MPTVNGLLHCDLISIRLRFDYDEKWNVHFCRVEKRRSQSDGRGGQFTRTQKKEV